MKEPVDHILRPRLPWRSDDGVTECGYDASKVRAISRGEYIQRRKDVGVTRSAMLTCMTCAQTAERWCSWEDDPRGAIGREVEWERGRWGEGKRGQRLKDELFAIADLIEQHRDQFDALVSERQQRREWLAKKDALKRERAAQSKQDRRTP